LVAYLFAEVKMLSF